MASEIYYPTEFLGRVATIIMGQSPPGESYNEIGNGIPFYQGVADFGDRYPTRRIYCNSPKRFAEQGDILLSVRAPIGRVNRASEKCAIGRGLAVVRGRTTSDTTYLEFFLRYSSEIWKTLENEGSVFGNAKKEDLEKLQVIWPETNTRAAIAHILGTLDDKIELNRRMNQTLEEMARAVFKSWFVDFLPVRAKAAIRREYPDWSNAQVSRLSAEQAGAACPNIKPEIAELFPDEFENSELGEIPKGWRVGRLGDVGDNPRRGVQPTNIQPGTPYIALEHMPKRCITLSDWGIADGIESNKFEFKRGEILFGKLRPYFHKVGIAPVDGVCSTDIVVVAPKSTVWFGFVLGHVSSAEFVEYTNAGSTGTKMPRTSWAEMTRYKIVLPPQAVARAFTERLQPFVDRIIAAVNESRTLAALRDTLLPKLISGELKMKDAEKFLKERGIC